MSKFQFPLFLTNNNFAGKTVKKHKLGGGGLKRAIPSPLTLLLHPSLLIEFHRKLSQILYDEMQDMISLGENVFNWYNWPSMS